MAHVLRLANDDQTYTIDLLSGTYKLENMSWQTHTPSAKTAYTNVPFGAQVSFGHYQPITETFNLFGTGVVATLLEAIVEMETVCDDIRLYHAGSADVHSWWLEWHIDGEEPKRSLLYSLELQYPSLVGISPFMECQAHKVKVALTRHPLWESGYGDAQTITTGNLSIGEIYRIGHQPGSSPGRIETLLADGTAADVASGITRMWIGIRPEHRGTANFNPLWECEWGINETDTSNVVDATAHNGIKKHCTFATDTSLVSRVYMRVEYNCAALHHTDYDHQMGNYLVLLRAKCVNGSSGTVRLQMRNGYKSELIGEDVYISSTSWDYYEMGMVQIPPWPEIDPNFPGGAAAMCRLFTIWIYAELVDGDRDLDLDYLLLIPTDHFCYINNISTEDGTPIYKNYTLLAMMPNDTSYGFWYQELLATSVAAPAEAIEPYQADWYMPLDAGAVVTAVAASASAPIGIDGPNLVFTVYPRWQGYRMDTVTT